MTTTTDEFADTIASWNHHPRCEVKDDTDQTCGQPATWHWRFHTCNHGIMCTHHLQHWLQTVTNLNSPAPCTQCGKTFTTPRDALKVMPL